MDERRLDSVEMLLKLFLVAALAATDQHSASCGISDGIADKVEKDPLQQYRV